MLELAIIGGGPSAVCVLEALAHHIAPLVPVGVTVFEPSPRLWHGQVFQSDRDEILANVPMTDMSVRTWDEKHGVRWLHEQGLDEYTPETAFPPRWLVGRYLRDAARRARAALTTAGSSARVTELAVRTLVLREGRVWVRGAGWQEGPFDQVVLCLGAPPSYDPYRLSGHPGYIRDPYPLRSALVDVPVNARVAVVGSGLTAVDVVMGLRAHAHQGPITVVSRNGLLPAVRRPPARLHSLRHLTTARLEALADENAGLGLADVTALATAELAEAGADIAAVTADIANTAPPVERLRTELSRASTPDLGWEVLRDAMVSCGQDAWYLLRDEDKRHVRACHQKVMRLCCPMPLGNAARLLELFETGQLDLLPGATSIRPGEDGGFEVCAERNVVVDLVIGACTPATHQQAPIARPLLASLVSQGLAVPHPFGGVRVDRTTSRLISWRGGPDPRLHALGDITHGAYLFTFGMPVLAARADRIVHDIAVTLREGARRDHHIPV
jgi:uncharacterized NAD(P)/FAD-binding protein YdhS